MYRSVGEEVRGGFGSMGVDGGGWGVDGGWKYRGTTYSARWRSLQMGTGESWVQEF